MPSAKIPSWIHAFFNLFPHLKPVLVGKAVGSFNFILPTQSINFIILLDIKIMVYRLQQVIINKERNWKELPIKRKCWMYISIPLDRISKFILLFWNWAEENSY